MKTINIMFLKRRWKIAPWLRRSAQQARICLGAFCAIAAFLGTGSVASVAIVDPIDDLANSAYELTRTYLGDDGSGFATRAIGNTVVGFSEAPGGKRTFVFKGTKSGMTITGQYWDVAKGASNYSGNLVLTYSNGGSTLTRTGGDVVGAETWTAYLPSQFVWPQPSDAGFQTINVGDLDGAFKGSDGGRAYVGQFGSDFIYYVERYPYPGSPRPSYSSVVIAHRANDASLTGTFYDLPRQTLRLKNGTVVGQVNGKPRRFSQTMYDGVSLTPVRSGTFTADYAVNLDTLAQGIENGLLPFTVGFSYAIAKNGAVVRSNKGGNRRAITATNDLQAAWPFTVDTVNDVGSTAKTVTLVAVLRALRQKGISVDSAVSLYLPPWWWRGPGMPTVTFRQLLSHNYQPTKGPAIFKPANCDTDPYGCLEGAVAGGLIRPTGYTNMHYTLFRVILPFVLDQQGMTQLFASTSDPDVLNEGISVAFRDEIVSVLALAGVTAGWEYPPGVPAAYRYQWGNPPTEEIAPTDDETDYLFAGSGGLKMSAPEFATFLSQLEAGAILNAEDLATAKAIGFGGTGPLNGPVDVGPVAGKNGAAGGAASQAMVFPGVEVFITRNSTGNPAQISDSTMLMQVWQAALIGPAN